MKKKIYVATLGVFILIVSYLIGQNVVLPLRMNSAVIEDEEKVTVADEETIVEKEELLIDCFEYFFQLEKIGYQKTEDNPWGETVSLIAQSEGLPEAILLTSETGIVIPVELKENPTVQMTVSVHPWVAEYSDGAILEVQFVEEGGKESSLTQEVEIQSAQLSDVVVDLSDFSGKSGEIVVKCVSGVNGDAAGDWLMMTQMNVCNAVFAAK